jgi:hypothetical protein
MSSPIDHEIAILKRELIHFGTPRLYSIYLRETVSVILHPVEAEKSLIRPRSPNPDTA